MPTEPPHAPPLAGATRLAVHGQPTAAELAAVVAVLAAACGDRPQPAADGRATGGPVAHWRASARPTRAGWPVPGGWRAAARLPGARP